MRLPSCPNEFKILIADRITAYHAYRQAHQALFAAKTQEQCTAAAQAVVKNYRLNQQIWQELKHYRDTGQILGLHPIFTVKVFLQELKQKPVPEVIKLKNTIYKSIVMAKKNIREGKEPHLTESRQKLIEEKTPLLEAIESYLKSL